MATVEELLAQGPPVGGGDTTSRPIGVPKGYVAPGEGLAGPGLPERGIPFPGRQPTPPRYMEGFQFTPATWSAEETARLQELLDAAGLYDPDDVYQRGWFNATEGSSPDIKAFKRLLTQANATGQTFEETLINLASQASSSRGTGAAAKRGRGGGSGGVTVEITSPADLRVLADRVSRKSIGKKLTPEQLNNFVSAYQGIEQQEAQARIGGAAGVRTGPPSADTFFEGQLQQQMPGEVFAHKFAEKFDVFQSMLGGPQVQAARPGSGGGTVGV